MRDRWQQVEQLYHAALERPSADRAAFLKSQCDDEALRAEIVSLLAQNSKSGLLADPTKTDAYEFATPLSIGATMGPYTIEGLIGKGGMGEVFRATDTRLGRTVAIKGCDARFSERFNREARAISSLNHPNICTLHDVGPNFIVMELVEGETLAELLKKGPLSPDTAARYGMQIADALAEAHVRSIVHRDLKPSNVMVTRHGVKVLDFGLAKIALESELDLTRTNTVMGTPAYMAPEQVAGKPADARADLFSLGLILYEMATGHLPFPGASLASMLTSGNVVVPPPSKLRQGIPGSFDALVAKLLAKDPAARPQTAMDVRDTLAKLASKPEPIGFLRPAVAAAALLALGIGGWFAYRQPAAEQGIGTIVSALPLTSFPGGENDPSFSPDGKQIAFTAGTDGVLSIYTMTIGSQTRRRLTEGKEVERWAAWSPDGSQIAYLRLLGGGNWAVTIVPAAGGSPRTLCTVRLTEVQTRFRALNWTPDSRSLVLMTQDPARRGILALLSVENGTLRPLDIPSRYGKGGAGYGQPDFTSPAFSPDGRWLAYADGGHAMIHRLTANYVLEGSPIAAPLNTLTGVHIAWLGNHLIFSHSDVNTDYKLDEWDLGTVLKTFWVGQPILSSIAISTADHRVRIVGSQGSLLPQIALQRLDPIRKVFAGAPVAWPRSPAADLFATYSPDGTQVAFTTTRTGKGEMWVADPKGGGQRQLSGSVEGWHVAWSRDGRRLAFAHPPDGELMVLDPQSGIVSSLPNRPKGLILAWSSDGDYLYASDPGGGDKMSRVHLAGGAVEAIGPGTQAQETVDGKTLIISRSDGLYSRPVSGDLAHNPEQLLVKDSPAFISVTESGVFYTVAREGVYAPMLRYYNFAARKSHDVGVIRFTESFEVARGEREILFAPYGSELDLISLEFGAPK